MPLTYPTIRLVLRTSMADSDCPGVQQALPVKGAGQPVDQRDVVDTALVGGHALDAPTTKRQEHEGLHRISHQASTAVRHGSAKHEADSPR